MTVVAVRKYAKRIEIASDSQTSYGDWNKVSNDKNRLFDDSEKIFEVNGMVVGCAGNVKGKGYLKIFCKTHKPKLADCDSVLDFLMEFNDWFKAKDDKYRFDEENYIIIIMHRRIFSCFGFSVQEVKEYMAIGSGMFLAIGAMYFGKTVDEAVEVAKEFDGFCSGKTFKVVINI